MENKITSIRCLQKTLKKLREVEIYPRETNEEIILRLIEFAKDKIEAKGK